MKMPTLAHPDVNAILAWWDANARDLPWRHTRDPYAIWVAETMLAQTQVLRVIPYYERWLERWPTVDGLARASLADVLRAWDGLGYPRRARNLHAAAGTVAREGWPPPQRLTDLPGVGPYTAAAIRCFALEHAVLPPDVNVRRVLARRFAGHTVDVAGDPWRAGQALMEFGQRVCTARRPRCEDGCPVRTGCPAAGGATDPAPRARSRPRYEGSLRQRRGDLLRAVLAHGRLAYGDADEAAAESLAADGMIRRHGDHWIPAA